MTYKSFQTLDKFTQVEKTLEKGVTVAHRFEYGDYLELFYLSAFYVELRYLEKDGEVIAICHSEKTELLEPYLATFDIGE